MSVLRAVLLLGIVSLLVSLGLFYLGSSGGYEEYNGGYAVLAADISTEEKILLEYLETGSSVFGGQPVSESTQWVLLDAFGSLERIPLDRYFTRVFSFDPRNDGYAEKLRDVFIKDDKRFLFIPLAAGFWNTSLLDREFNKIMLDIPFSVEYYGITKPTYLFFVFYAAASLGLLVICYVNRYFQDGMANIIPLIPVLSSLSLFGAFGIATAALILGFFMLMREPFADLVKLPDLFASDNTPKLKLISKEILKPYRLYWPIFPLFAAAMGIVFYFSQLSAFFLLVVFAASFAVFLLSFKKMSLLTHGSRKRFSPVLIIKKRFPEYSFSVCMLPFAAAAFLAVFFTPYISGEYVSTGKFDTVVEEQDYYTHLIYQATFSTRQLGTSNDGFQNYLYDKDGLPSPGKITNQYIDMEDFPPFPLKQLTEFFHYVNNGGKINDTGNNGKFNDILSVIIPLLLITLILIIKRKSNYMQKMSFTDIKNFTWKFRFKGINRNKSLLYNTNNKQRIRKDA